MEHKIPKCNHSVVIESYGVTVTFSTNDAGIMSKFGRTLDSLLGRKYKTRSSGHGSHEFSLVRNRERLFDLFENNELKYPNMSRSAGFDRLVSDLRLKVAEFAVDRVFVHAGAVSWRGRGIVIPARSFKGKSSLTAALVRSGARYYSDEYAVIDINGYLHPFAKDLSLRGIKNEYEQTEHTIEDLGGRAGTRPVPVEMVVVTEYKKGAIWRPRKMNNGKGILELINNAVAIRRAPEVVLPSLANAASGAEFVKSPRGEADETAIRILKWLDETAK